MFLVRQSKPDDASTLEKLARMVYFINLPPDEKIIRAKIEHSQRCFARAAGVKTDGASRRKRHARVGGWADAEEDSELFMFSIEDAATHGVIGTSQLRAHQGGPGNPNWTFRISEKVFRSERLGWGSAHKVGQLVGDESSPSEIGGLILQPSYRGHAGRPGRLLSFVRFHWIGLFRRLFAGRVLGEMMGPVSSDGDSVFWDHFGRKFIPVRFAEADRFCQHNRGFISDLLPKEEIYLSLFPLEVQNQIGVVGKETLPARRLLESQGFRNRGYVDPFDGGPHMDAVTDEIPLVRTTRRVEAVKATRSAKLTTPAIISALGKEGDLRATECPVEVVGKNQVRVGADVLELIGAAPGATIGFTPLTPGESQQGRLVDEGGVEPAPAKRPRRNKVRP